MEINDRVSDAKYMYVTLFNDLCMTINCWFFRIQGKLDLFQYFSTTYSPSTLTKV